MDIQLIMSRFAEFAALSGEDLAACQSLCRDAAAEIAGRSLGNGAGAEQLCSASAALAYYRFCLLQSAGCAIPRIGHTVLVTAATLAAAKQLCEEYLTAAAPFLRSEAFGFRQVKL